MRFILRIGDRRRAASGEPAAHARGAANSANRPSPANSATAGFTLIELMIVMVIIGILSLLAIPRYVAAVRSAREAVLKEDLHVMRTAIDSYTMDKQKAPQALSDLVQDGYLKTIPEDPFTHSNDTWQPDTSSDLYSVDQTDPGIIDVHSGSQESGTDGQSYSTW